MPFEPVLIPFTSGIRQDKPAFQAEGAQHLSEAINTVFTKAGAVRSRPEVRSRNANVQVGDSGVAPASTLGTAFTGLTAAGIVAAPVLGTFGAESPMVLFHGGQAIRTDSLWLKVGEQSFFSVSKSPVLRTVRSIAAGKASAVACGTNVVGLRKTPQGLKTGLPVFNANNRVGSIAAVAQSSWDSNSDNNVACAGDAVFYGRSTGSLRCSTTGGTDVEVATGGSFLTNGPPQVSAVVDAAGTTAFVAFVSATAGRITLKKVTMSTGSVVATLDVNGLGTVRGCSLAYADISGDKLVLAWVDTAGPSFKTKAFTSSGSTITDAALDLTDGEVPLTADATETTYTIGTTHNNQCFMLMTDDVGSLWYGTRSFTAAIGGLSATLYGSNSDRLRWNPMFATSLAGRTFMGVLRRDGDPRLSGTAIPVAQWFVADVTSFVTGAFNTPLVVAHGQYAGGLAPHAGTVGKPTSTSLAFGIVEGLQFSDIDVTVWGPRRVVLTLQPAALAPLHNGALLTGGNAALFDGRTLAAHPFPETYPRITETSATAAGGTLLGGSYTYQATWEVTNSQGQIVRSGASDVKTITGVPLNNKNNLVITVPQFLHYPSDFQGLTVILWATERNPSAGAPLYYAQTSSLTTWPTSGVVTIAHTTEVVTTGEQLYTGGGVLDDEPPPAGDRGVAFALDRAWVAAQDRVYASKLLDARFAVGFNTEGLHTLLVPGGIGEIQGLAGYEDHLVIVCSNGVATVRGAGYDDSGNGPGWTLEVLPAAAGAASGTPRRVASTPLGCVYVGTDRGIWTAGPGGVQRISGPASDTSAGSTDGDLCYLAPRRDVGLVYPLGETSPMLFHGSGQTLRFLDAEWNQWGTWNLNSVTGTYHAGVNGVLWVQDGDNVYSYDATYGSESVTTTITTGWHRVGYWGRVRKIRPIGMSPAVTVAMTLTVRADGSLDASHTLVNAEAENWVAPATDGLWPRTTAPEWWTTSQRCREVQFTITTSPFAPELIGLEVEQWSGGDPLPSNTRT